MDWLTRFDAEVGSWSEWSSPPCEVLADLAAADWAPADVSTILNWTATLERFTVEVEALCGLAALLVPLRGSRCPRCDASTAYRRSGSERLRQAALWVGEHGALCYSCGAKWCSESEMAVFRQCLGLVPLM